MGILKNLRQFAKNKKISFCLFLTTFFAGIAFNLKNYFANQEQQNNHYYNDMSSYFSYTKFQESLFNGEEVFKNWNTNNQDTKGKTYYLFAASGTGSNIMIRWVAI